MPRRGGRHYVMVKGAEDAMNAFKYEIAKDLGLDDKIDADGTYKNMSTLEVGQVGGEMVRRVQAAGEWAIMQRYKNNEKRLMPEDILPPEDALREITNNGNPTVQVTKDVRHAPNSGQQKVNTDSLMQ